VGDGTCDGEWSGGEGGDSDDDRVAMEVAMLSLRLPCKSSSCCGLSPAWLRLRTDPIHKMKRRLASDARGQRHVDLQGLTELGIPATRLLKVLDRMRERRSLLDVSVNLRNIRDAVEEVFSRSAETRIIRLDDGTDFAWDFCNFGKLLDVMSSDCPEFGDVLRELHHREPSSMANPWGLVVYFDETVPGDPLRLDQRKKFMSVYVAIANMGIIFLKHERCWLTLAICRTNIIKHVPGKWSHMLRIIIRSIVLDVGNVRSGLPLACLGQQLAFFKISNFSCGRGCSSTSLVAQGGKCSIPMHDLPQRLQCWCEKRRS